MANKRGKTGQTNEQTTQKRSRLSTKKDESKNFPEKLVPTDDAESVGNVLPAVFSGPLRTPDNLRLHRSFFQVPCIDLARALLGQNLVRMVGSQRVSGRIVETEAYLGLEDKAAHSYKGKRTERTKAMFMEPGTVYVYNIYGIYCCLNISSQGEGCAVLLRALEPLENIEVMRTTRGSKSAKKQKDKEMTNGPSKLCQALQISKLEFNQSDLTLSQHMWLEKGDDVPSAQVVCCPRINIGYAEEWTEKPLRFYVLGNGCVSSRDKSAEIENQKQLI